MKTRIFLFSVLIALLISFKAQSQAADNRGLEIAIAADQADQGFGDITVNLVMTLKNKNGQVSTRNMSNQILEQMTDGDKSLIIFNSPRDVKGTATLTYTHKVGADDQWLYLPSIKRVKRISSDNKSGPFMGSEFAYEDLSSQEVEKYTYNYVKEEKVNAETIHVVERDPVDAKSGYTRQVTWFNANKGYRVEKVEFYDRKNSLLKTLTYHDYNLYLDKYWRAGEMHMVNHQTEKETTLVFTDYKFQSGLEDVDFSQNSLKRVGR